MNRQKMVDQLGLAKMMDKHSRDNHKPLIEAFECCLARMDSLESALARIANLTDSPEIDVSGEWQMGLHCGVEDRDCQDRYDGADYGHTVGVEKALEWARNEAVAALSP